MTDWSEELTEKEYRILRQGGTEKPFSGELLDNEKDGIYKCAGCGQVLFDSDTKFKSGSGWPSFYDCVNSDCIKTRIDNSLRLERTEIVCSECDGHLGHVFNDGPEPTGKRYCVNSIALDFEEE